MSERFTWTEPKLCSYNYDLTKNWFIYFDFTDTLTSETLRKQFRGGINLHKTKEDRMLHSNALKAFWKTNLKAGWNPFGEIEDAAEALPTITTAIEKIIELKTPNIGDRTLQTYKYVTKLFLQWMASKRLQHILCKDFVADKAQQYMDNLILTKGYSGRTYNDHLTVLSTFFNCFVDRDWVAKNPFAKIKKQEVEVGRNIAFTEVERELLKQHLYDHDRNLFYFTQFIYYGFIRRSELTRLRIFNIDFRNQTIIIPSSASKNKKQESVVIPQSFIKIIEEMKLQDLPQSWFIFGRYLKPGPVQYKNYNHISTRHTEIIKGLGIDEQKGLYSWKHSGVCDVYRVLNGDMYSLMRQLRHSELTTTQIYLKSLGLVDNTAIRNAAW